MHILSQSQSHTPPTHMTHTYTHTNARAPTHKDRSNHYSSQRDSVCVRGVIVCVRTHAACVTGSLLIATIVFESFMPARCWMAPEMPTAMYKSGATTFPVWPTCRCVDGGMRSIVRSIAQHAPSVNRTIVTPPLDLDGSPRWHFAWRGLSQTGWKLPRNYGCGCCCGVAVHACVCVCGGGGGRVYGACMCVSMWTRWGSVVWGGR